VTPSLSLQPQRSCDQHERDGEHGEWDDVDGGRAHADVKRETPFSRLTAIASLPNSIPAMAISGDMIGEGANIDFFAEAGLLGFGLKRLDLIQ
jgi:hypothetical protein